MDKLIPTEHDEQVTFVRIFRLLYPAVRIFAIPNGGIRNKATAVRLRAEGVERGVPDLFIPEWKLWIEMKKQKGGILSQEQKEWIEYLNKCGYKAVVCKGCDAALALCEKEAKGRTKLCRI